jgi:hypothetical protein
VGTSFLLAAIVLAVAQVARYVTNTIVAIARVRSEERRQRLRIVILMHAYEHGGRADLLAAAEAMPDQDSRAAVDLPQLGNSPDAQENRRVCASTDRGVEAVS